MGYLASVNAADRSSVLAKMNGEVISYEDVKKGSELDIYQAEKKLYEIKMGNLRRIIISKLIALDPKSKGMEESAYITTYVAVPPKISDKQISDFIKEKKIPADKINQTLKERVRDYLINIEVAGKVDIWFDNQVAKRQIEISLLEPKEPTFKVPEGNSPYFGGKDAKVTVVEYSDFECPYCVKASHVVQQLREKYGNKIKFIYKQFPLNFHANAQKAAEASLCAYEQGAEHFWTMHNALFASQNNLKVKMFKDKAKSMGLDTKKFSSCLDGGKMAQQVKSELAEGMEIGVSSTPAFFINGRMILGAQPLEAFVKQIDLELAK